MAKVEGVAKYDANLWLYLGALISEISSIDVQRYEKGSNEGLETKFLTIIKSVTKSVEDDSASKNVISWFRDTAAGKSAKAFDLKKVKDALGDDLGKVMYFLNKITGKVS